MAGVASTIIRTFIPDRDEVIRAIWVAIGLTAFLLTGDFIGWRLGAVKQPMTMETTLSALPLGAGLTVVLLIGQKGPRRPTASTPLVSWMIIPFVIFIPLFSGGAQNGNVYRGVVLAVGTLCASLYLYVRRNQRSDVL